MVIWTGMHEGNLLTVRNIWQGCQYPVLEACNPARFSVLLSGNWLPPRLKNKKQNKKFSTWQVRKPLWMTAMGPGIQHPWCIENTLVQRWVTNNPNITVHRAAFFTQFTTNVVILFIQERQGLIISLRFTSGTTLLPSGGCKLSRIIAPYFRM